ncbi:MAG: GTP-dependent dephospho-CoA kinase family protein [Thaumarchaeota archaeon]|nr:GTP-dependent dephospho-CoA kinase family protein [Nitrososphaerota archaeon]
MGLPGVVPINSHTREELKHPLGQLIPDEKISKESLSKYFANNALITVCVGDRTTERVHEFGLSPRLEIVDSLERRMSRKFPKLIEPTRSVLKTKNPAGSISQDALGKLGKSLALIDLSNSSKIRIEVEGEEDLLALPVVAFFPDTTITFYGQPGEGMVIVDSSGKERSKAILAEIGILSLI